MSYRASLRARCPRPVQIRELQTARAQNALLTGDLELCEPPAKEQGSDGGGVPNNPPTPPPLGRAVLTGPPTPPPWWLLAAGALGYGLALVALYAVLRWALRERS